MEEDLSRQVEALKRQVYELGARREPVRLRPRPAPPPVETVSAYWLCETLKTQDVTSGSDWDPTFNNASYDRWIHGVPTGLGEISCVQPTDNNNRATRCRLLFRSPQPFPFDVLFTADDFGFLQYKLNNAPYTQITAQSSTTLNARAGVNVFQVSIGAFGAYARNVAVLCRILRHEAGVQWIDPFSLDLEGYPPPGGGIASGPDVSLGEA